MRRIWVQPVAPSFHARDILCPAAAHLAVGMPVEQLGAAVEPDSLKSLAVREECASWGIRGPRLQRLLDKQGRGGRRQQGR